MVTLRTIMVAFNIAHHDLNTTLQYNSTTANLTGRQTVLALVAGNGTYADIVPSLVSRYNADFSNIVPFVFRGQIVAISVAAGLIGLILIREWIGQLDWQPRPAVEEEGELRPEDWVFRNGRAIRKTDYDFTRPRRRHRHAGTAAKEEPAEEQPRGRDTLPPPRIEIGQQQFGDDAHPPPRPSPSHVAFAAPEQLGEEPFWGYVRDNDKGKEPERSNGTAEPEAEAEAGPSRPAADVPHDVSGSTTPGNKDLGWRLQDALENPDERSYGGPSPGRPGYESPHGTAYPQSPPNGLAEPSTSATEEAYSEHPPLEEHDSLETVHSAGSGPDSSPDFRRASDPGPPASESPRPPQRPYGSSSGFPVEIIFESPPTSPSEKTEPFVENGEPSSKVLLDEATVDSPAPATPAIIHTPADDQSPDGYPFHPLEEPQPEAGEAIDGELDEWTDTGDADAEVDGDVEGLEDEVDEIHEERIRDLIVAREAMANPLGARERLAEIADLRAEIDMMAAGDLAPEDEDDRPLDADDWDGILEVIGFIGPLTGLVHNHIFVSMAMSCTLTFLVGLPVAIGKLFLAIDPVRGSRDLSLLVLRSLVFVADGLLSLVLTIAREILNLPRLLVRPASQILGSMGVQFNLTDPTINLPTHFLIRSWDANTTIVPDFPTGATPAGRVFDGLEFLGNFCFEAYKAVRLRFVSVAASPAVMDQFWCLVTGYAVFATFLITIAVLDTAHLLNINAAIMERARDVQVFLKVLFFMTLEMVMFPLFVGIVIDLCTMPLFGATVASRIAHYGHRTFGSLFIAWLIGSIFMFSFAAFLTHMRTICRQGALYFIRDPSDPAHSPVRDIMERPALVQLPRLAVSAVMYCVIVFTIFGTMPYFMWALGATTSLFKGVLPLRLEQRPLSSVPFDLLFLHLIVPPSWEGLKVYTHVKQGLAAWWLFVVRQLELSSLVFGVNTGNRPMSRFSQLGWIVADAVCQRVFGTYDNRATPARVPNSDRIKLLSLSERRKEGMFILLDSNGAPRTPADEIRLLKQDRAARRAGRNPKRDYTVVQLPEFWRTRVYALFASAMLSAAAVVATVVLVPLCVGRMATNMVFHEQIYDGYNWIVGGYICWGSYALGKDLQRRIITYSRARRIRKSGTSTRAKRVVLARLSNAYALALLYFAFPLLVGVNFELFIGVPARYGLARGVTPVLHLWDAWAMGVAFISIFVGVIGFANEGGNLPLAERLRDAFKHPLHQPFVQLSEFVLPILAILLVPITVPWAVFLGVRTALAGLGLAGFVDGTAAFRLTYPLLFVPSAAFLLRWPLRRLLGRVRQWMIDAEYVVYERVENYEPEADDGGSEWEDVDAEADGAMRLDWPGRLGGEAGAIELGGPPPLEPIE
ncbi:hypothetical protein A1Q1_04350 [Trichosporon asahii var. asahii CBS 2479]|uniref:RING-type E3 ubiquitin transferase n=1 Tax=Trichosporon asahii var. asahii (strain ATCC 90039 / CBS 2479 / JCM 2466 / KCTC 7840 / NBRC 103889/ NCYC 2677 / UAMH 7654) TaxID=1186058 RepID=J6EVT9_TRIAS|nr:hypothetical protein A1Q1_04350 [Trichosporon asahii var. asahii CBS 2479]EJT46922.1 hypothetical protein A1Q1_04350 [Trichosporon asahii var. asahii CBS 2479]